MTGESHHHPNRPAGSRRWITWISLGLGLWLGISLHLGLTPPAAAQRWGQMVLQGLQIMQMSNLSPTQEVQLGRQIDQQILDQFQLSSDANQIARINQIGQGLAQVSDRPNLPYTFRVVQDPSINAFATLGGFVYITTTALRAADSADQVAAVLAHEIAHITEQHALEQMQRGLRAQAGAQLLGLESSDLAALVFELGVNRPHSREDEYIADAKGVQLLLRSGYDPTAMAQFLTKLNQGSFVPELFSTHPHIPDRIARLNQLVPSSGASNPDPRPSSARTGVQVMPLLPGIGSP